MTYAQFLLLFVVPPALALAVWVLLTHQFTRKLSLALSMTSVFAVVCTGPWDHFTLTQGTWSYPAGRLLGPSIGLVPVEEYCFFVLQVLLTGLLTAALLRRWS